MEEYFEIRSSIGNYIFEIREFGDTILLSTRTPAGSDKTTILKADADAKTKLKTHIDNFKTIISDDIKPLFDTLKSRIDSHLSQ